METVVGKPRRAALHLLAHDAIKRPGRDPADGGLRSFLRTLTEAHIIGFQTDLG